MTKYILLPVLLLFCVSLHAQNKFLLSYNPGVSLYNSENSIKIIGNKHIDWFPGFSFAYEKENLWELNFLLEYNYSRVKVENVLEFTRTNDQGEAVGSYGADLVLSMHNFDIAVNQSAIEWLSISIGPTFSFVNRTIAIDKISGDEFRPPTNFEDRLVSICLGANGSANLQIPLNDNPEYLFFFSSLKLRYLHSIWFDKRGRNVDDYYQSFLVGQLNLGLGYNF